MQWSHWYRYVYSERAGEILVIGGSMLIYGTFTSILLKVVPL